MSKGTASFGKRNSRAHTRCRRCGRHSYHVSHKECSSCGFGRSAKLRSPGWARHKTKPRVSKQSLQ